jgi:hypothetical protein
VSRPVLQLGLLICTLLAPFAAQAQDRFCAGTSFADGLTIGRIKPDAAKVFFRKNGDKKNACPSMDAACQDTASLASGDLVALGAKRGPFVCADFDKGEGDRAGWLPAETIEPAPLATDPAQWLGDWKRAKADISIAKARDGFVAQGEATFGALDPEKIKRGAVHTGAFAGPLIFRDSQATLVDASAVSACALRLARAGDFLFVRDNGDCGGLNVSFSGVYRRAP